MTEQVSQWEHWVCTVCVCRSSIFASLFWWMCTLASCYRHTFAVMTNLSRRATNGPNGGFGSQAIKKPSSHATGLPRCATCNVARTARPYSTAQWHATRYSSCGVSFPACTAVVSPLASPLSAAKTSGELLGSKWERWSGCKTDRSSQRMISHRGTFLSSTVLTGLIKPLD